MQKVTTLLCALALLLVGDAFAQQTEYVFTAPAVTDLDQPYPAGQQSGARGVNGPYDLDGDGKMEVLVTDYTAGGRIYVIENQGVDTWELVYQTPVLDSTNTSQNGRYAVGGDLDGDGFGEIIYLAGRAYSATNPNADLRPGVFVFEHTGADNDYGDAPASIYDFAPDTPDRWASEMLYIEDIDGDGVQELLIPNNGSNNRYDAWWGLSVNGNIGSGFEVWIEEFHVSSRASEDFDPVNRGGGSAYAIYPADLDGDGTFELSLHSWNSFNFTNGDVVAPNVYSFPDASAPNVFYQAGPGDHVALFGGTVVDINNDGDDEVFYPRYQSFGSALVSVLNYEAGEDPMQVTADNFALDIIGPLTNFGLTAGDLDGDGNMELIGVGSGASASAFTRGEGTTFLRIAEFIGGDGGDPENPANYELHDVSTTIDLDENLFNEVTRDSAGVITTLYEPTDGYFPTKIAYLGDTDGDGDNEVAVSFQSVNDTRSLYTETWQDSLGGRVWLVTPGDDARLGTANTERGMAYNADTGHLLVASRNNGALNIYAYDGATGAVVDTLDVTGIEGGLFATSEVAVTSDGQIFSVNLNLDTQTNAIRIYRWADEASAPEMIFDGTLTSDGADSRYGDVLAVSGSGDDVTVFLGGSPTQDDFLIFDWTGTAPMAEPTRISIPSATARGGIAPVPGEDAVWINGYGTTTRKVSTVDGSIIAEIPAEVLSANTNDIAYAKIDGGEILLVGPSQGETFVLVDVTDAENPRVLGETEALGASNAFHVGGVAIDAANGRLYVLSTNNGLAAFGFGYGWGDRTLVETVDVEQRAFMRIISSNGLTVAVEDQRVILPKDFVLSANYPNPFNPSTTFEFTLPLDKSVSVKIYDVAGRLVKTLVNDQLYGRGTHKVTWDGTSDAGQQVASGTYLYSLEWGRFRTSRTMVLVK